MTMKYPTLRECIRKFLYFHKYSYGIVVRRHGILKIRRFQVKSVATLVHRKETQRTNSNRVARKIHSTVITCHDTPFSFFSFFFCLFFNIFYRQYRYAPDNWKPFQVLCSLSLLSLSLSIFRSLVRYIPFFFLVFSRIASAQRTHA